jgi:hypothetical protein
MENQNLEPQKTQRKTFFATDNAHFFIEDNGGTRLRRFKFGIRAE